MLAFYTLCWASLVYVEHFILRWAFLFSHWHFYFVFGIFVFMLGLFALCSLSILHVLHAGHFCCMSALACLLYDKHFYFIGISTLCLAYIYFILYAPFFVACSNLDAAGAQIRQEKSLYFLNVAFRDCFRVFVFCRLQ